MIARFVNIYIGAVIVFIFVSYTNNRKDLPCHSERSEES